MKKEKKDRSKNGLKTDRGFFLRPNGSIQICRRCCCFGQPSCLIPPRSGKTDNFFILLILFILLQKWQNTWNDINYLSKDCGMRKGSQRNAPSIDPFKGTTEGEFVRNNALCMVQFYLLPSPPGQPPGQVQPFGPWGGELFETVLSRG